MDISVVAGLAEMLQKAEFIKRECLECSSRIFNDPVGNATRHFCLSRIRLDSPYTKHLSVKAQYDHGLVHKKVVKDLRILVQ